MMEMVIVRLKRPSGSVRQMPSKALNEALTCLADADEFQPLLSEASREGKALAIDVFQNRSGQPFLIHLKKEKAS
jgi:hypothetical protein